MTAMTNEQIIQWARAADPYGKLGKLYEMAELTPDTLRSFAELVAAAEREECATLCDEKHALRSADGFPREASTARALAAAIRARGEA